MVKKFFGADENGGLRKFALRLDLFLLISGAVFLRGDWDSYRYWAAACQACLLPAWFFPRLLKPVRAGLRVIARLAGLAVTYSVLMAAYFLVLTPLALAARLLRKKFLALDWDRKAASYWTRRDPASESRPERQY